MTAKTFLVDTHPDIAAEWHPTRNGDLDLATIGTFSNKKVWWLHTDARGDLHEFRTITRNRTFAGSGCVPCSKRGPDEMLWPFASPRPGMSLAERDADVTALWHPTRNGNLTARDVTMRSERHVWWQCAQGHEWIHAVKVQTNAYTRQRPCLECVPRERRSRWTSLAKNFPDVAAEWHPTKNGDLTPADVRTSDPMKVWWYSDQCGHAWKAPILSRTANHSGCSKCRGTGAGARFADFHNGTASTLADKAPAIAAEWHPTKNGNLTPADVTYGSSKRVFWQCAVGHEWEVSVNARTGRNRGCWCCTYPSRVPVPEDLGDLGRSLALVHPSLAAQWHPSRNGLATPSTISARSDQNVWWQCTEGHRWTAKVSSRVANGAGCRSCANTEERARRAA